MYAVARCQVWEEMLEVEQKDMDYFTPCGLYHYTVVWRMREKKHCWVNQSEESKKFYIAWCLESN